MNPNYSSPRHFAQTHVSNGAPFYHPQKDSHPTFTGPNYPKSPNSAHFIPGPLPLNSKSYIVKPQYEPIKTNGNSSGYLKTNNELTSPQNSNMAFNQMFSKNSSEMTKSSFHDNNRFAELNNPMGMPESKVQVSNTPTRRQPRFSEPAMFDSPY